MEAQLRQAVWRQDLRTVQGILQQPVGFNDVNATDTIGWTALHSAVFEGHLAIVQAILQVEGVNVHARTVTGCTPLRIASRLSGANQLPIIQALLEAGADPHGADIVGERPLFSAARYDNIHVVEALLDGGADPAARNNNLDTPLHIACRCGHLDMVQVLIQRQGAECLTLKNNREETPLDRIGQTPMRRIGQIRSEVNASIRQHILQAYAGVLAQRDGLLCLHSVLQDTAITHGADAAAADDDSSIIYEEEFQLPVGKLKTEHLQKLLEYIIAMEPGSVRALNSDGLLPVQYASELGFPASVLYFLLRPYPDMLVHAFLPSHPQGCLQSICQAAMTLTCCNRWSRTD